MTNTSAERNRDYYWYLAKSWAMLPGIGKVPRLQRLCETILEHDDEWIRANRKRLDRVMDSDHAQLFLIGCHQLNWMALYEITRAKKGRVRREAKKALDKFYRSIEWAQEMAFAQLYADPKDQAVMKGLLKLRENWGSQPAVVRNERELERFTRLARGGRYMDLDWYLDRRLAEIKRWWKQKLGVPSHRKASRSTRFTHLFAYNLRCQGRTWSKVASLADNDAYKADPKRTVDRIKKGVKALQKRNVSSKEENQPHNAAPALAAQPRSERPGHLVRYRE